MDSTLDRQTTTTDEHDLSLYPLHTPVIPLNQSPYLQAMFLLMQECLTNYMHNEKKRENTNKINVDT